MPVEGIEITDEDKNGFMLCIHKLDRSKGLDLILHTPGGDVAATESLVDYLRKMFGGDICAFVPQIAMSAGTMIACSCREIFMGTHSNLGPVDPQFNGIPAYGVIQEVERAYEEIKQDNTRVFVWNPILSRYPPSFLQQCHWAVERTEDFVKAALQLNMLSALPDNEKADAADRIFKRLFDLTKNKGHDEHFHAEDCKEIGLTVTDLEADKALQDLVLTVHHCYMHTLANTGAAKLIENHLGRCYAKLIHRLCLFGSRYKTLRHLLRASHHNCAALPSYLNAALDTGNHSSGAFAYAAWRAYSHLGRGVMDHELRRQTEGVLRV